MLRDINDFPIEIRRGRIFQLTIAITTQEDGGSMTRFALAQGPRDRGIVTDVPEERSVMDDGCPLLRQL